MYKHPTYLIANFFVVTLQFLQNEEDFSALSHLILIHLAAETVLKAVSSIEFIGAFD
jgi:hypothetical protein